MTDAATTPTPAATHHTDPSRLGMPPLTLHALVTILFAGAAATVAFDVFGQALSPMLGALGVPTLGSKLAPVGLAQTVLVKLSGLEGDAAKAFSGDIRKLGVPYLLHSVTGLLAYPLGWLLIARPVARRVAPSLPWIVGAVTYGVVLWVFALYVMAHLIGGMPAFLGFSGITWVALWGHILFAVVAAGIIERRLAA